MPDVPKADIIAVAQAALAVAVAFGAPLNPDQQKSLLALATVIAAILVAADVKRRGNRAANADKIAAAQKPKVVPQAFATDTATTNIGGMTTSSASGVYQPLGPARFELAPTPAKVATKKPAAKKRSPKKAP